MREVFLDTTYGWLGTSESWRPSLNKARESLPNMYDVYKTFLHSIINTLHDSLSYIFSFLEKLDTLPEIIVNLGLGILTILIPLAIAILTDYYQKRREPTTDFAVLDLHVILDEVFKIKMLLFYVGLIFTPMLIWEVSPALLRLMEIIISTVGIVSTVIIILHVYKWTKGNIWKYRFSYVNRIKKREDLEMVWRSVWQTTNIIPSNEKQFFDKFSSIIDQLLKYNE